MPARLLAALAVVALAALAAPVLSQSAQRGGDILIAGGYNAVSSEAAQEVAATGRAGGRSRYETAAAILEHHPDQQPERVWLASGDAWADALAAAASNEPLLLTPYGVLDDDTRATLSRLDPDEVVIAGGYTRVSDRVEQTLAADYDVARLDGDNRYDTAGQVADRHPDQQPERVWVASGENWPDALAAASTGEPLLLTGANHLPSETEAALRRLDPETIAVAGNPPAISDRVGRDLARIAPTERVGGRDRFETARRIAAVGFPDDRVEDITWVASGRNWPDGLVAASTGAPLLLTEPEAGVAATVGEAARLSGDGDDRSITYLPVPHPDDEMAAWAGLENQEGDGVLDRGDYPVFILLTRGEASAMCDGRQYDAGQLAHRPSPGAFGDRFTDRCAQHRVDSFHTFLDLTVNAERGVHGRGDGRHVPTDRAPQRPARDGSATGGAPQPAWGFDYWVADDHARFVFDLGDSNLHADEVVWAVETVRAHRHLLPVTVERDILAGGFYGAGSGEVLNYRHTDHGAVFDAVTSVDFGVAGEQLHPVESTNTGSRNRTVPPVRYCQLMCVDTDGQAKAGNVEDVRALHAGEATPLVFATMADRRSNDGSWGRGSAGEDPDAALVGAFQHAYGWLTSGGWPYHRDDLEWVSGGFSQQQHFTAAFPGVGRPEGG